MDNPEGNPPEEHVQIESEDSVKPAVEYQHPVSQPQITVAAQTSKAPDDDQNVQLIDEVEKTTTNESRIVSQSKEKQTPEKKTENFQEEEVEDDGSPQKIYILPLRKTKNVKKTEDIDIPVGKIPKHPLLQKVFYLCLDGTEPTPENDPNPINTPNLTVMADQAEPIDAKVPTKTTKHPERRPKVLPIPQRPERVPFCLRTTNKMRTTRTMLRFVHTSIGLASVLSCVLLMRYTDCQKHVGHPTASPILAVVVMTQLLHVVFNRRALNIRAEIKYHGLPGQNSYGRFPMVAKTRTVFTQSLMLLACAWLCIFGVCILFGAPMYDAHIETLTLSALLVSVSFLPQCLFVGPVGTLQYMFCDNFELSDRTQAAYMQMVKRNALCALFGAWAASACIILDWDREWQKYPVPNICGALIGLAASNAFVWLEMFVRLLRYRAWNIYMASPFGPKRAARRVDAATNTTATASTTTTTTTTTTNGKTD